MADGFTYYEVLGVRRTASATDIKSAYREAARRYHPDHLAGGDGESHLFTMVGQAYEVLSDPAKRAQYDRVLDGPVPGPPDPQPWSPCPVYAPPAPVPTTPAARSGRAGAWFLALLMIGAGVTVWTLCRHGALGGWMRGTDQAFFLAVLAFVAVPVLPLVLAYMVRALFHRMVRRLRVRFR